MVRKSNECHMLSLKTLTSQCNPTVWSRLREALCCPCTATQMHIEIFVILITFQLQLYIFILTCQWCVMLSLKRPWIDFLVCGDWFWLSLSEWFWLLWDMCGLRNCVKDHFVHLICMLFMICYIRSYVSYGGQIILRSW